MTISSRPVFVSCVKVTCTYTQLPHHDTNHLILDFAHEDAPWWHRILNFTEWMNELLFNTMSAISQPYCGDSCFTERLDSLLDSHGFTTLRLGHWRVFLVRNLDGITLTHFCAFENAFLILSKHAWNTGFTKTTHILVYNYKHYIH